MRFVQRLIAVAALLLPLAARAQVGRVTGPTVTRGEWKIFYNLLNYFDETPALNNDLRQKLAVEYSVTEKWALQLGSEWRRSDAESLHNNSVSFEVKREFTDERDGCWLSSGAKFEYYLNTAGHPDEIQGKLLFQKEHTGGRFRHRANLGLAGEVGPVAAEGVDFGTRWYSRWNAHKNFKPGFEWHAGWGRIDHLDSSRTQRHYLGPACHGELFKAGSVGVSYEIAYVFGLTGASRDGALRFRLETAF